MGLMHDLKSLVAAVVGQTMVEFGAGENHSSSCSTKIIVDEDGDKIGTWEGNLIYDLGGSIVGYADGSSKLNEYSVNVCLSSFHGKTTGVLITNPGSVLSTLID